MKKPITKNTDYKTNSQTDWSRIDATSDDELDYAEIPELGETFFKHALQGWPPPTKQQITIRLDSDVLEWLRAKGKGYQSLINHLLKQVKDAEKTT